MIDSMELVLVNDSNNNSFASDPLAVLREGYDPLNLERFYRFIDDNSTTDYSLSKTINGNKYNNRRTYRAYESRGIKFEPLKNNSVLLTINGLHNVVDPTDNVTVFTPQDKDFFFNGINEVLTGLNAPPITSLYWQVQRVDYCINVPTQNKQLYLDLLNRSRTKSYQEHKLFNGKSVYIQCGSVTINIYDKEDQMNCINNNPYSYQVFSDDDFIKGKDVLRIEVQCREAKVKALQKKYGWKDKRIANYLDPKVATYVLKAYAKQFYIGKYHTAYKDAPHNVFELITNAKRVNQKTKANMTKIVSLMASNAYYTLDNARKEVTAAGMSQAEYTTAINRLTALDVNPIPISKRQGATYHVRHLKSLYSLIDEYINNRQDWTT